LLVNGGAKAGHRSRYGALRIPAELRLFIGLALTAGQKLFYLRL